jgi:hypothetical protein
MRISHLLSEQNAADPSSDVSEREVESAILELVDQHKSCPLDALVHALDDFTFSQVFLGLDRLRRQGKLIVRHHRQFDYLVSAVMSETTRLHPPGN